MGARALEADSWAMASSGETAVLAVSPEEAQVGAWGLKEQRYLENLQVEPDILVYNDPASDLKGIDVQLEAAVKEMLETIDKK